MPSPVSKIPFLAASVLFAAVAGVVARIAPSPLDAIELVCLLAATAAASAFATAAFTRRPAPSPAAAPQLSPADFAAQIAKAVETRLAAADQSRRNEILRAVAETPVRQIDIDALPAPAPGSKTRLGRGLLGLMHGPGAITTSPAKAIEPDPSSEESRAA